MLLRAFSRTIGDSPEMLLALDFYHDDPWEVVIVTPRDLGEARPFLDVLRANFVPSAVLVVAVEGEDARRQAETIPLLAGKTAREGKATAYVCQRGTCKLPTNDAAVCAKQLLGGPASD
jgi:hypothetical protein